METKLVERIAVQRNSGYIVTMLHIQQKALKLSNSSSFKASIGWGAKVHGKTWSCFMTEDKNLAEAAR